MNLHRLFCETCSCETLHRNSICRCGTQQAYLSAPGTHAQVHAIKIGKRRGPPLPSMKKPSWAAR